MDRKFVIEGLSNELNQMAGLPLILGIGENAATLRRRPDFFIDTIAPLHHFAAYEAHS